MKRRYRKNKKMQEIKMLKMMGVIIVILILFIMIMIASVNRIKSEQDLYMEEYIVSKGDTFWDIYEERYSDKVSYAEAMYNFKKDNNMSKYDLIEGQTVLLRTY